MNERQVQFESEARSAVERLVPFLDSIDHDYAMRFLSEIIDLYKIIYHEEYSPAISQVVHEMVGGIITELGDVKNLISLSSDEKFMLARTTYAIWEIIDTHFRGYPTPVREEGDLGMHMIHFDPSEGLIHGSMADTQRELSVDQHHRVWELIRNHPALPVCGEILRSQVQAVEACDQSTHPLYADYKALKAEFYRLFVNMNKDVPTTDSQVDIARAASIIRAMRAIGKPLRSVAVAGSGDMARFEGQLFQLLQKEGITFEEIIAVDRVDYGAKIAQTLPELQVDFHQGDILDVNAFGGKKVNMLLYPWSVFSDILPVRDSIQALHTAASLLEPGGIMIVDQAVPIGASSYKTMQAEQATHTGAMGVFERSFNGADGEELWSAFNIMELESFLRDAAQAGFVPRNIGATVQEQHALVETIEANEQILVREAETKENLDAMAHPIYQANGWNRMTLVLEYIGQEEALREAKAGKSLFHLLSCTAMGETEDGS